MVQYHCKALSVNRGKRKDHPTKINLCFLTNALVAEVVEHLGANGVEILEGPVRRTGATGPIKSVYSRGPDENLIEILDA